MLHGGTFQKLSGLSPDFSLLRGLTFETFGHIDKVSDIPEGYAAHMDYDYPDKPPTIPSLYSFLRVLGVSPKAVSYSPSKRGIHVTCIMGERLSRAELVALQAILGSDPWREILNLMRARQIRLHKKPLPKYWRQRWNILYDRKTD